MRPRAHISTRLACAVCFALLFTAGHPAIADEAARTGQTKVQPANLEEGPIDILPTLKGHMARLGSLMNVLFRNIDDPARAEELISIADEMEVHLRRSERVTPLPLLLIGDPKKYAAAEAAYQKCLTDASAMLAELKTALRGGSDSAPRDALLRLDQKRRDCHVAFG
ncbi:MAG: hypothetical protein AAGF14_10365 [Pseudomonadota bacterium]